MSARAMRARAVRIRVGTQVVVDTCGTGGDGARDVNVSTPPHSSWQGRASRWQNAEIVRCHPNRAAPTC